jgi:hypothetical protein
VPQAGDHLCVPRIVPVVGPEVENPHQPPPTAGFPCFRRAQPPPRCERTREVRTSV